MVGGSAGWGFVQAERAFMFINIRVCAFMFTSVYCALQYQADVYPCTSGQARPQQRATRRMTYISASKQVGLFITDDGAIFTKDPSVGNVTDVAGCRQMFDVTGFCRYLCFCIFVTFEQLVTVY